MDGVDVGSCDIVLFDWGLWTAKQNNINITNSELFAFAGHTRRENEIDLL